MRRGQSTDTNAAEASATPPSVDTSRPRQSANAVLRLIWSEREISRAEISRQANLSRSTVSDLVSSLLPTGLVTESGSGESSGGRRPIVLQFQDQAFCILGVEMGATHVAVALTDLRGRVLEWQERNHPVRTDPDGTRALINELCDTCLAAASPRNRRLLGIGVALPSPVNPQNPEQLSEVVLPEWKGHSGLRESTARYGVPLFVDNDANLGALAELWWGAAVGFDDFAYVKIATGVGSGHVIGGQIYRGATGVAGEIGHLAMDPHGDLCMCGLKGCLATLVGAPALVARARTMLAAYPESVLRDRELSIEAIEDAAIAADPLALQLSREAAEHLGIAIAGLLNLMNPAMVIVGGGLARLGELLLAPLRDTVNRRTLVSSIAASEIRASELGPRAIAIGAATQVLDAALADSQLFATATGRTEASC